MSITTGILNAMKQLAADAVCPSASTLKIGLIKVGATGTYDQTYSSAYSTGLGGDECATANGYTQGGISLTNRSAGPSGNVGWVDYDDAVWTAVGNLSAIGAFIYDTSQSNRIVLFVDFGGTKTASDATFTVQIPDTGTGMVRIP